MESSKKILLSTVGIAIMIVLLTGVTFAFFNYTRTGSANTIKVGRIAFNTNQTSSINLTNVFPMSKEEALNDNSLNNNVTIEITGDTDYSGGIEYLVSSADANITTTSGKIVPLSLIIEVNNLGNFDVNYFTKRDSATEPIYKNLNSYFLEGNQPLLVGYIPPNSTQGTVSGINGSINIKGYFDEENIAITDTYGGDTNNVTTSDWVNGRKVFTTEEWRSLKNNPISFKVKVEANEGIWVNNPLSRNKMMNIVSSFDQSIVKEFIFIQMSEENINTHENLVDVTYNNEGVVKGWTEGDRVYIASPGETYFPSGVSFMFTGYTKLERIVFGNINTSEVVSMAWMFDGLTNLKSIDLSRFDTSNVESMQAMFRHCTVPELDLSTFNTSNVTNMISMFADCNGLTSINIDSFDFTKMNNGISEMFAGCNGITSLDLSKVKFGPNTSLNSMLYGTNIKHINLSGNKIYNNLGGSLSGYSVETVDMSNLDASGASSIAGILNGSSNLKTINASGMIFGSGASGLIAGSLPHLESINLSNADLSRSVSVGGFLSGSTSLKTVNLSGAIINNVLNLGGMFSGLAGLETIDFSNTDFSNVVSSTGMFSGSNNVETMNFANSDFSSLENASSMFSNMTKLSSIDFTNANFSNLTNTMSMFQNCTSLTTLDISSFNTSNVSNMDYMFAMGTYSISGGVTTWTPNNNSLITIKVGNNWSTNNVTYSDNMFYNCTSLVGGSGTTYDANHVDKEYARIDTPGNPGYLTLKTT